MVHSQLDEQKFHFLHDIIYDKPTMDTTRKRTRFLASSRMSRTVTWFWELIPPQNTNQFAPTGYWNEGSEFNRSSHIKATKNRSVSDRWSAKNPHQKLRNPQSEIEAIRNWVISKWGGKLNNCGKKAKTKSNQMVSNGFGVVDRWNMGCQWIRCSSISHTPWSVPLSHSVGDWDLILGLGIGNWKLVMEIPSVSRTFGIFEIGISRFFTLSSFSNTQLLFWIHFSLN